MRTGYEADSERASGRGTAKPPSIKCTGCRSGGCALKAVELTSGDLRCCHGIVTENEVIHSDRAAEVSRWRSTPEGRRKAGTVPKGILKGTPRE